MAGYPPPAALDHLAGAVDRLRLGAAVAAGRNPRLAARPLWHLTLVFLGEVADDRAAGAGTALRAGVAAWQATGKPAPRLRLAGGGRFGRRRSTVLWVGLAGDLDGLSSLGRAVRRELRRARFPVDRKPFRPHLTLARPGDRLTGEELAADVSALGGYEGPEWTMMAVQLVHSTLGPKPAHQTVATVLLSSDRPPNPGSAG